MSKLLASDDVTPQLPELETLPSADLRVQSSLRAAFVRHRRHDCHSAQIKSLVATMYGVHIFLLLCSAISFTLAVQTLHIKAWPFSASKPLDFATVTYNELTSLAVLDSYTPFTPASDSAIPLVRIGYFTSQSETESSWSGIAVPSTDFATGKNRTLRLWTAHEGGPIERLSFSGVDSVAVKDKDVKKPKKTPKNGSPAQDSATEALGLEVLHPTPGPLPVYNKPVVLNRDGQLDDKAPEKSFLQK